MVISEFNSFRTFFKTINNGNIDDVCLGFTLGMFLGLIPFSINSLFFVLLMFVLKLDKFSSVLSAALFAIVSVFIDPFAHTIGLYVLTKVKFLMPVWTSFYNMPLVPFTGFNNTIVMGNTVIALVLMVPVYSMVKKLIPLYRASPLKPWTEKVFENKHLNNLNKVLSWFDKFKQFKGEASNG